MKLEDMKVEEILTKADFSEAFVEDFKLWCDTQLSAGVQSGAALQQQYYQQLYNLNPWASTQIQQGSAMTQQTLQSAVQQIANQQGHANRYVYPLNAWQALYWARFTVGA